jgi:RNA polymerase sigma factor (sigma-70 family)
MDCSRIKPVLRQLRRLAVASEADEMPDAALLEAFTRKRDEDAFAALVRRHGPLVWRVCRRSVGRHDAAQDAFQATFLVLARKAASIRNPAALVGWLHQTAFRIACVAKARERRGPMELRTELTATTVDPTHQAAWRELGCILEQEVARLPERLRLPILACYWQGLTNEEAARRLGWASGTLKARLARARALLHARLARRGVTLPVGALALLLAPNGSEAQLDSALAGAALRAAQACASSSPGVAPEVAALAQVMLGCAPVARSKLALVLMLVLGLGLATLATAGLSRSQGFPHLIDEQPTPQVAEDASGVEPPSPPKDLHGDPLPDGAVSRLGTVRFNHGSRVFGFHCTPDGKTIVSVGDDAVCLWDAATGKERSRITIGEHGFGAPSQLLADGKTLLLLCQRNDTLESWDLEQGKRTRKITLPIKNRVIFRAAQNHALSPDGRLCSTHADSHVQVWDSATGKELYRLPREGTEIRAAVFAGKNWFVSVDTKHMIDVWDARSGKHIRQFDHGRPVEVIAASPDGRFIATLEHHTHAIDRLLDKDAIQVWDLTSGTRKHTITAPPKSWLMGVQFSPDSAFLLATSIRSSRQVNGPASGC